MNGLRITELRLSLRREERLLAFATLALNDAIAIRGIKIIKAHNGRVFVAMPARQRADETFQDIVHPICKEARAWLEQEILTAFYKLLDGGPDAGGAGARKRPDSGPSDDDGTGAQSYPPM